jgi:hypothetical protein
MALRERPIIADKPYPKANEATSRSRSKYPSLVPTPIPTPTSPIPIASTPLVDERISDLDEGDSCASRFTNGVCIPPNAVPKAMYAVSLSVITNLLRSTLRAARRSAEPYPYSAINNNRSELYLNLPCLSRRQRVQAPCTVFLSVWDGEDERDEQST